jgi:hypothetical protein
MRLFSNGDNPAEIAFGQNALSDPNTSWSLSARGSTDSDRLALYAGPRVTGGAYLERVTFLPNGNVGISTTGPTYKLAVGGTLNATTIYENGTALASKYAAASHAHAIANVTGLQTALDAKLAVSAASPANENSWGFRRISAGDSATPPSGWASGDIYFEW